MILTKVAETDVVVEEVGRLTQYLIDKIPALFDFVIEVILALLVFTVGAKLIGWIRKLVKRSLERANVDKGVSTFADSMLKFGLYAILVFSIGKNFGLDTTSVAAAFASAGPLRSWSSAPSPPAPPTTSSRPPDWPGTWSPSTA